MSCLKPLHMLQHQQAALFLTDFNMNANRAPIIKMKVVSVCVWLSSQVSVEVSRSQWSVWWTPVSVKSGIVTNVCEEKPSVKSWEFQGKRCERKA